MAKTYYSDEERAAAIELARSIGASAAARQLNIKPGTIASWVHDDRTLATAADEKNVESVETQNELRRRATQAAMEASKLALQERHLRVQEKFLQRAEDALDRAGGHTRIVRVEKVDDDDEPEAGSFEEAKAKRKAEQRVFERLEGRLIETVVPTPQALRDLAVAAATFYDKFRLSAGEATARTEYSQTRLREHVERVAEQMGLNPDDVMAEAQRILAGEVEE